MSNVLTMWKQRSHEGQAPRLALDDKQNSSAEEKVNAIGSSSKGKPKKEALTLKENTMNTSGISTSTHVLLGRSASVEETYNDGMHHLDTLVSRVHNLVTEKSPIVRLLELLEEEKHQKKDYMLENQLMYDEKQCTEQIMLVDMRRNDVGKVTGELHDSLTNWDVLRAALPVGTVSAAPKG